MIREKCREQRGAMPTLKKREDEKQAEKTSALYEQERSCEIRGETSEESRDNIKCNRRTKRADNK